MSKGAISLKTVIIIVIMLLVGVLGVLAMDTAKTFLSGAAAGVEPKDVLASPKDDGKSATITWTSEKDSQAVVEYGTTPASLLLRAAESATSTVHSVSLSPLKSGTSYYFRIRVGEEVFDNSGIPFSFKTKTSDGVASTTISPVPSTASVPTMSTSTTSAASLCNKTTDYNGDGTTNSFDLVKCIRDGGKPGATTPTAVVTKGVCEGVDFDNNGIVNSVDRIKCLQSKQ